MFGDWHVNSLFKVTPAHFVFTCRNVKEDRHKTQKLFWLHGYIPPQKTKYPAFTLLGNQHLDDDFFSKVVFGCLGDKFDDLNLIYRKICVSHLL